jgi:hypothetical protein
MASTFSQQLRYLKRHEPSLYESVSKAYRKCLMESNLAPDMAQTDDEAAKTPVEENEIKQTSTKGVNDLMSKVHAMVGVNENKKEGEEIFDNKDDDVETVQPDPQQQAELFGQETGQETPNPPPADNGVPEAAPTEEAPAEEAPTEEQFDYPDDLNLDNLFGEDTQSDTGTEEPAEDQTQQTDQGDTGDLDMNNLL